jgi:hypothetical protein
MKTIVVVVVVEVKRRNEMKEQESRVVHPRMEKKKVQQYQEI